MTKGAILSAMARDTQNPAPPVANQKRDGDWKKDGSKYLSEAPYKLVLNACTTYYENTIFSDLDGECPTKNSFHSSQQKSF